MDCSRNGTLAAAVAATLVLGAGAAPAQSLMRQQPLPQGRPEAAAARQPQLDAEGAMIAYHRLSGSIPDFSAYAERSQSYQRATAFDRDQVKAREMARLDADFRNFDTTKQFLARLTTSLGQYDMSRKGYSIPLNDDSFVGFYDSVARRQFGVQFRNPEAINFIPMDVAAARDFAQRNMLDMQNAIAANVVLELTFRLAEAGPQADSGPLLVRADIVGARVLKGNAVLHEFRSAPDKPKPALPRELKAADVQGLRIGMPRAEAEAIAAKGYAGAAPRQIDGTTVYFDGLREGTPPICGAERGRGVPAQQPDGTSTFFTVPDNSSACVAFDLNGAGGVSRVVSGQRLDVVGREQVQSALAEKYGPPTAVLEGGTLMTWTGADPAVPGAPPILITARVQERGSGALRVLLLGIELRSTAAGAGRTVPRPGGPRL